MATLNLFPARIRFTNTDGTLTPEAYRALQVLFERVGGALGDNGADTFGDLTGVASLDLSLTDTVTQPVGVEAFAPDVTQPVGVEAFIPDVVQPSGGNALDKVVVKAGTATAPSITTDGDENTGLYFPAADKVSATTGGVERLRVGAAGDIAMATGKKFYFDGVLETGDTYLIESAANVVDLYVGGVKALTVTTTGTTLAGHPKLEGITATGATGTGKLVFDSSPTLISPNLGTPSTLVGTNITGTAAGLSVGYATSAGSSLTVGVTGTKTPPTSVTVTNGLVTAWT